MQNDYQKCYQDGRYNFQCFGDTTFDSLEIQLSILQEDNSSSSDLVAQSSASIR